MLSRRQLLLLAGGAAALAACSSPSEPAAPVAPATSVPPALATPAFGEEVIFALPPTSNPRFLLSQGNSIADYVTKNSGYKVKPLVAPDLAGTLAALASGQASLAWLPAGAYVKTHKTLGMDVVVRGLRGYGGGTPAPGRASVLFAGADGGIGGWKDLQGKRVAFVANTSLDGYLFAAAAITSAGLDPARDVAGTFAGSHEAALLALLDGKADAAVSYEGAPAEVLGDRSGEFAQKMKAAAKTEAAPNDCIAVAASMDQREKTALRGALLKMKTDPEAVMRDMRTGQEVRMVSAFGWEDIAAATDADYDPVRRVAASLGVALEDLAP